MTALAVGLLAVALMVWPRQGRADAARSRLAPRAVQGSEQPAPDQPVRPWLFAGLAGAGAAVFAGGAGGLVLGAVVTLAAGLVLRRIESPQARRLRQRRGAELPAALGLLAVCLRAGLPTGRALAVVGGGVGGPLAPDLLAVAALHDLGADARSAWAGYADDPVLGQVARAVTRVADSGSELAAAFESLAQQSREHARQDAETSARRAGVAVLAPLGLCFLPAFVCLGVVPTVLGVAGSVL